MKGPNHHMSAALFLGLLALFAPAPPAEAQFLKKLSKGLEKVNNALDKVEKVVTTPSATTKKSDLPINRLMRLQSHRHLICPARALP